MTMKHNKYYSINSIFYVKLFVKLLSPKVFSQKNSAILDTLGDISTFGNMGTK